MMYLIAVINFAYAPLMFLLRTLPENVPATKEVCGTLRFLSPLHIPLHFQISETAVDGNATNYEKIEGLSGVANQNSVLNDHYHYDVNPDWN